VAACELAHLIYFENPGKDIRTKAWERVIPPVANNRGSFIRVFAVDLDGDGKPEIVSPNKGAQGPRTTQPPTAISWFKISGSPLDGKSWVEHELTKVVWPINSQPVDLDGDGDLDIVGGSVAETRIILFENMGARAPDQDQRDLAHGQQPAGESQKRQQRSGQRFQYGVCRLERGRPPRYRHL